MSGHSHVATVLLGSASAGYLAIHSNITQQVNERNHCGAERTDSRREFDHGREQGLVALVDEAQEVVCVGRRQALPPQQLPHKGARRGRVDLNHAVHLSAHHVV